MPLLQLDDLLDLLACPACGQVLTGAAESLRCTSKECRRVYPSIGKRTIPLLIDSVVSIVDVPAQLKNNGDSQIRRSQRWWERLGARLTVQRNRTAEHYARLLARDLVAETAGRRPRLLVVGGGEVGSGIESLYEDANLDLIAFDIYASEYCQFVADGHQVPLLSGTVDGVLVQAVLEHVLHPQRVVDEIYRVLRPGGLVYADTPFMQQVHEGPYDFTRFSESGHRYLFRRFTVRNSGAVAGLGTQLHWSLFYFGRGIHRRLGQILRLAFFWLPMTDRWLDPRVTVDGASSVFFYGQSSPSMISPHEIIDYYSGGQR
jgi:SAM-dependent methyltransferase/uncharacterized protein YbaR (Trm112 family)